MMTKVKSQITISVDELKDVLRRHYMFSNEDIIDFIIDIEDDCSSPHQDVRDRCPKVGVLKSVKIKWEKDR